MSTTDVIGPEPTWQRRVADALFRRTPGFLALIALAVVLLAGMGTAATFLSDAHLPGTIRPSMNSLASPTIEPTRALEIVRAWNDWDDSISLTRQDEVGPWQVGWLVTDCAFALVLARILSLSA